LDVFTIAAYSLSLQSGFSLPERLAVKAERRQVTDLFTDMVGFTIFSEKSGDDNDCTQDVSANAPRRVCGNPLRA
jgi:hypothetical protein